MTTNSKDEIMRRASERIHEILDVPIERISGHSRLSDDLGADSLEAVELVMALEEEFQVQFGDVERDVTLTVDQLVDRVQELLQRSKAH